MRLPTQGSGLAGIMRGGAGCPAEGRRVKSNLSRVKIRVFFVFTLGFCFGKKFIQISSHANSRKLEKVVYCSVILDIISLVSLEIKVISAILLCLNTFVFELRRIGTKAFLKKY